MTVTESGDLDAASAPYLRAALRQVCREGAWVDVDLSGITFLDCAGLRPLTEAHQLLDDRFAVIFPSPAVTRLYGLLRLEPRRPVGHAPV